MARISIEDCQKKIPNRFALVMTAAHRARQLLNHADPLVETKNKEAVIALREIAEGLVINVDPTPEPEWNPALEKSAEEADSAEDTKDQSSSQPSDSPVDHHTEKNDSVKSASTNTL